MWSAQAVPHRFAARRGLRARTNQPPAHCCWGFPLFTNYVEYTDRKKGNFLSAFEYRYGGNPLAESTGMRVKVNKTRRPDVATLEPGDRAVVEAVRVVLSLNSGMSVSSFSVDPSVPVETIEYRSPMVLLPNSHEFLNRIRHETNSLIEHAVDMVANGYRPYRGSDGFSNESDEEIWPMTNAHKSESGEWVFDVPHNETHAPIVLRVAWSTIQGLAVEALEPANLSTGDVWDIVYPNTTARLAPEAYRLAARAVAGRYAGVVPDYLSIFNWRGHPAEMREHRVRTDPFSIDELVHLAFSGMLASERATGETVVDYRDEHLHEVFRVLTGGIYGRAMSEKSIARRFEPVVKRFLDDAWNMVDPLAQRLIRDYSLVGNEINDLIPSVDHLKRVRLT